MPIYNASAFLRESIDSVLRQNYTDFELLLINDGSNDSSKTIIKEYADRDVRIVAVHQHNIGLVATLNKGVKLAKGEYIARIDGDDPWLDNKLAEQINFLDTHQSVVLVGGGFEVIDEKGYYIETVPVPTRHEDIIRTMTLRNTFGHAGVVFRKDAFNRAGGYRDDFGPTEDYDLWIRLANIGRVANLAHPVYRYRINRGGISQQNSERQAQETKLHASRFWTTYPPSVISRSELLKKSKAYLSKGDPEWYGIALKQQMLADNAQIGVKMIRYRRYTDGLKQILAVTSTGRTGVREVKKRISSLTTGSLRQNRNLPQSQETAHEVMTPTDIDTID